jgi:hypothetical protein
VCCVYACSSVTGVCIWCGFGLPFLCDLGSAVVYSRRCVLCCSVVLRLVDILLLCTCETAPSEDLHSLTPTICVVVWPLFRLCFALVMVTGGHIFRFARFAFDSLFMRVPSNPPPTSPRSSVPASAALDSRSNSPQRTPTIASKWLWLPTTIWGHFKATVQHWLCEEWDPLSLRQPYTFEQDMQLLVHRCQLRLKWRTDLPKAADYPLVAMYIK